MDGSEKLQDAVNKRTNRLLLGENVEVRQLEEGLRGSWQIGRVIGVSESARDVRYEKLMEDDGITECVERIGFSDSNACCRGRIRPVPPDYGSRVNVFWYGLCVDVLYEDGWWEGVVFDHELESGERCVFFPDEGDELRFSADKLRLTLDWDEVEGDWRVRGTWKFLVLIDEFSEDLTGVSPVRIKQLWYKLRQDHAFAENISEWTLGGLFLWRKLIKQALNCNQFEHLNPKHGVPEVVSSDDECVHKRRKVGEPADQCRTKENQEDVSCVGSAKVATSFGDFQARHTEIANSMDLVSGFVENVSTELPNMIENSDEPSSFQSSVTSMKVVPKDLHNAGSADRHNYLERENSKIVSLEEANEKNFPSLQPILDYVNMRNGTPCGKGNKELTEKARMQLKSLGWKVEPKVYNDKAVIYKYVSPEGKHGISLTRVCRDLIARVANESDGRTVGNELLWDYNTGVQHILMDVQGAEQSMIADRMVCDHDKGPNSDCPFVSTKEEEKELLPEDATQLGPLLISNRVESVDSDKGPDSEPQFVSVEEAELSPVDGTQGSLLIGNRGGSLESEHGMRSEPPFGFTEVELSSENRTQIGSLLIGNKGESENGTCVEPPSDFTEDVELLPENHAEIGYIPIGITCGSVESENGTYSEPAFGFTEEAELSPENHTQIGSFPIGDISRSLESDEGPDSEFPFGFTQEKTLMSEDNTKIGPLLIGNGESLESDKGTDPEPQFGYTEEAKLSQEGGNQIGSLAITNRVESLESCNELIHYVNTRKHGLKGKTNMEATEKARLYLQSIAWRVQCKYVKNRVKFRYLSPHGKYYSSLIDVCRYLIPSVVNESNGITGREVIPCQELGAVRDAWVNKEQLQHGITEFHANLKDDEAMEDGVIEENIAIKSDEVSDPKTPLCSTEKSDLMPENSSHQTGLVLNVNRDDFHNPFTAPTFIETIETYEELGNECNSGAIMDYVRLIDENKRLKGSVSQKLIDTFREKAKEHLLTAGWTFFNRVKNSCKEELRYVTPDGKRFSSFYAACSAYCKWEKRNGNSLKRCKGSRNTSKNERTCSLQSPYIKRTHHINNELVVLGSPCEETFCQKLDLSLCNPPPHMKSPTLKDVNSCISSDAVEKKVSDNGKENMKSPTLKDVNSCISSDAVEKKVPDNGKEKEHSTKDCSITITDYPENGKMVCIEGVDVMDQFLESNDEINNITSSECHEDGTQIASNISSKCNNVRQVHGYSLPNIEVGEQICSQTHLVPVDEIRENGLVATGSRRGKPTRGRKRKQKKPPKTCVTRSYARSKGVLAPSTSGSVKSTLSWLIDKHVVVPREKVFYIGKKDKNVMAEGRITSKGIVCSCCTKTYSLINFEAHAGSNEERPVAHMFLKDGRSLLQCQSEALSSQHHTSVTSGPCRRMKEKGCQYESDDICSICYYGGSLILCDRCPSSFHLSCVNLEVLPEGEWFCPSCRCAICSQSDFNDGNKELSDKSALICDQCELEYHAGYVTSVINVSLNITLDAGAEEKNKIWKAFQRATGFAVESALRNLGKPKSTPVSDLHWTIMQSSTDLHSYDTAILEKMTEFHSKISIAHEVLHECFVPIFEPRTKSDLVADLLFNRSSELNRLHFRGFYTILLERGDELISVAVIRVHGEKVAEMPLIATRVQYRRQGMCRLLVNELKNMLSSLGVERFILPAAPQVRETWIRCFAFTEMTTKDRDELLAYTFLDFQDTTICEKLLKSLDQEKNRKRRIVAVNRTGSSVESPQVEDSDNLKCEHQGLQWKPFGPTQRLAARG